MDKGSKSTPRKQTALTANDVNRVIPKLATRVFVSGNEANTVLTFAINLGEDSAHVIETVAFDKALHKKVIKLLQDNLNKKGGDNE